MLEGGIIYDDRRGRIVFESFNNPRREQRTRPIVINDEDVYEGKARDTDAGILNEIVGQYTEVNVLGLQDITIIDPDGDDLPYSVTVSANNSVVVFLRLNLTPATNRVLSWVEPVLGTHYTVTPTGADVTIEYEADDIFFYYTIKNNTSTPVSYTHLTLPTTPYV